MMMIVIQYTLMPISHQRMRKLVVIGLVPPQLTFLSLLKFWEYFAPLSISGIFLYASFKF